MTSTNNTITQKNVTNVRLFVLFVVVMLSSTGVFGQNTTNVLTTTTSTEVSVSNEPSAVITSQNAVASSSMDFAVWFMGVKNTNTDNTNTASFSKKTLINSGVNTNSVLIRSILKRVSVQGNSLA